MKSSHCRFVIFLLGQPLSQCCGEVINHTNETIVWWCVFISGPLSGKSLGFLMFLGKPSSWLRGPRGLGFVFRVIFRQLGNYVHRAVGVFCLGRPWPRTQPSSVEPSGPATCRRKVYFRTAFSLNLMAVCLSADGSQARLLTRPGSQLRGEGWRAFVALHPLEGPVRQRSH